jgi:uncharacterized protein (DUF2164 family)
MAEIRRGLDILSKEDRDKCIKEIISFVHDDMDKDIGVIAAENILDFFLQRIGPDIYNKAVEDTKKSFREKFEGWEIEVDLLKKSK